MSARFPKRSARRRSRRFSTPATPLAGQELRLRQEYFFTSASLLDLIRRHIKQWGDVRTLGEHAAVQLNDTHPAIGIAELMRILVDLNKVELGRGLGDHPGDILLHQSHPAAGSARNLAGAVDGAVLPRHMQIIYLINAAHLDSARRCGIRVDAGLLAAVSLIDEHAGRRVRMGNLAFIGSHKINGVSGLHTDLMRKTVFHSLNSVYPGRIVNKTNGITFRRWLIECNPDLTEIIGSTLGERALDDYHALKGLGARRRRLSARASRPARRNRKVALARVIADQLSLRVDPDAMFDVQVKRIHEYKRQLLNLLETVARYNAIRANPTIDFAPRVKIFSGKAAASYTQAKLIIKLAIDVAKVVNSDPTVRGLLKVVFLPNYNVSLAEIIMPAADLSEQISTAGMEASGTGNMKMALNGALTVGTLDGANVEMRDMVGDDNIFIFGMTATEVEAARAKGIDSTEYIAASPILREALDEIGSGVFSTDDAARYRGLVDMLTHHDYFMICADFDAYWAAQMKIDEAWRDRKRWMRSSILNTANVGWFSSDRTIAEYATEIWNAPFTPIV